jgi:DNA gyrase subunit A
MCTRKGVIKKTLLQEFWPPSRNGVIAIQLDEDDILIGAELTDGNRYIMLITQKGNSIKFSETHVRSVGRSARGVRGVKLREADIVTNLIVLDIENLSILTICENGFGKKTPVSEYRRQSRAGFGIKNIKTTSRNGLVVNGTQVAEEDEILVLTKNGMIIRIKSSSIKNISRNTSGVRMVRLDSDDKVASLSAIREISQDKIDVDEGLVSESVVSKSEEEELTPAPVDSQEEE